MNARISCFLISAALSCTTAFAQNTTAPLVLEAKSPTTMQYFVEQAPEYETFIKVVHASGLEDNINGNGHYTIIAPKNKAFDALPSGMLEDLMMPQNKGLLQDLLTFHIIAGNLTQDDIKLKIKEAGGEYSTLTIGQGGNLVFTTDANGNILVKDYAGVQTPLGNPIIRNNGVIYTVDRVLQPQKKD